MQPYSDIVTDKYGNAVAGVSVTVTKPDGNLAALYDAAGAALANPVVTDVNGRFSFRAANGTYTLNATGTGISGASPQTVMLDDPAHSLRIADLLGDWVVSGGLPVLAASLTLTTPAAVAYIGARLVEPAAVDHLYTAARDTYVDLSQDGVYIYTEVANGAAEPAVAANSLRLFVATTNAVQAVSVIDRRVLDVNLKSAAGIKLNGGAAVKKWIKAAGLLDFGAIAGQSSADSAPIAAAGATPGSPCRVGTDVALPAGIVATAFCVGADAVVVRLANVTAAAIDPGPTTFTVEASVY